MREVYVEDWFKDHLHEIRECSNVIKRLQSQTEMNREIIQKALDGVFFPIIKDFNAINDKKGFKFRNMNNEERFMEYKQFIIDVNIILMKFLQGEVPDTNRCYEFLDRVNSMIEVLLTFDFSNIAEVRMAQQQLRPNTISIKDKDKKGLLESAKNILLGAKANMEKNKQNDKDDESQRGKIVDEVA